MRKQMLAAAIAAIAITGTVGAAVADTLMRKESAHSVAATLDKLEAIVKSKGATVFARIDHAAGATKAGAVMRPTQVLIFGNPKLGTPIMQMNQEAGLDLPMRVLAYQAEDGKVWLVYRQPSAMAVAHDMPIDAPALGKVAGALDGLTSAAVKP